MELDKCLNYKHKLGDAVWGEPFTDEQREGKTGINM